jgi:hypothetical protein
MEILKFVIRYLSYTETQNNKYPVINQDGNLSVNNRLTFAEVRG